MKHICKICSKSFYRLHPRSRAKCCSTECSLKLKKEREALRGKDPEYLKSRRENEKIKAYYREYNRRPDVLKRRADLQKSYKTNGKLSGWSLTAWSNAVKLAWNNTCAICSSTKKLEAHHIIPRSVMPEYSSIVENGICLCNKCHKNIHMRLSL